MEKPKKLLILCVLLVLMQPFCTMFGMQTQEPDYIAESPMHHAAWCGDVATLEAALKNNDLNRQVGPLSYTPLHIAAKKGHVGVVKALLDGEANPDAVTSDGRAPLYIAIVEGHENVVGCLLNTRVQCDWARTSNSFALTPAHAETGHFGTLRRRLFASDGYRVSAEKVFVEGVDRKSTTGVRPDIAVLGVYHLHVAVQQGNSGIVQRLLNAGADPDGGPHYRYGPLFWAVSLCHLDIVRRLLNAGANPNGEYFYKSVPLEMAIQKGHTEIVKLLSDAGAAVK